MNNNFKLLKMKNLKNIFIVTILALFSFTNFANASQLLITPTRIIFEDNKRSGRVIISNPSDNVARYKVILSNKRMTIDGKIEDVKKLKEGEKSANDLIRFSPKRFTLEPKTSRTIRIKLKNLQDIEEGEYRSHLRVEILPESQLPQAKADKLQIQVKVNYGVSIPLIVRKGKLDYSVEVSRLKLDQMNCKNPKLNIVLNRSGKRSSHGDISIFHINQSKEAKLVKHLKGIAIFVPNNKRNLTIDINNNGKCFKNGKLKFIYSNHNNLKNSFDDIKESEIIAQRELDI